MFQVLFSIHGESFMIMRILDLQSIHQAHLSHCDSKHEVYQLFSSRWTYSQQFLDSKSGSMFQTVQTHLIVSFIEVSRGNDQFGTWSIEYSGLLIEHTYQRILANWPMYSLDIPHLKLSKVPSKEAIGAFWDCMSSRKQCSHDRFVFNAFLHSKLQFP